MKGKKAKKLRKMAKKLNLNYRRLKKMEQGNKDFREELQSDIMYKRL